MPALSVFVLSIIGLILLLFWRAGRLGPLLHKLSRRASSPKNADADIARIEAEILEQTRRSEELQLLLDAKRRLAAARAQNDQLQKSISEVKSHSGWITGAAPVPRPNRGSSYRRSR
jgi:hypothetical protein